jgi:serpin B
MTRRDFLSTSAAAPALLLSGNDRLWADIGAVGAVGTKSPVVAGNTAFASDIYGQLGKKTGNLFCSPFSMSAALAMTSGGAAGDTLSEIVKVFHFPSNQSELHASFGSLIRQLNDSASRGGYELKIANALWGQSGFPFLDSFTSMVKLNYGAGFQTVDFKNPEAARQRINRWVEEQTKDKIKDLFQSGTIDADTRMVLANAIYFKGTWQHKFMPRATSDAEFMSGGQKLRVPTMHQTERFGYAETDAYQVLEMRYQKSSLVMDVILPRATDGLGELETKFNPDWLQTAIGGVRPEKVIVSLPKFKTTISYNLTDTLAAMGMSQAFSRQKADFSRMTEADRLMIGVVVHKAFVDVTEEGTEAAAATGVGMKLAAAPVPQEPKVFNANHPFLFVIRDTASGSVLFLGRMTNPKA